MSSVSKAVFLSYASQDADAARRVCDALRAGGVEVWFDADGGLEHGDEWDAKIRRQIKECVLFIALVSANTQARHEGYFRIEWELAAQRAMGIASGVPFILPMVIDATREPDALVPDRFRVVQWTRLPGGIVTPQVQQRLLKLWSHRTSAARDQARDASEGLNREQGQAATVVTKPRIRRLAWGAAGLAMVGIAAAIALLGPRKSQPASTAPAPVVEKTAPALTEAQKLTRQARALIDDDLLSVRENFRLAEELCQRATTLDPGEAEAWATHARVSLEMMKRNYDNSTARQEAARSSAERAIRLAPTSIESELAMATYLHQRRSHAEAEERFRSVLQRAPADPRIVLGLARTLVALERTPEATELRLRHPAFGGRDPRPLIDEAARIRGGPQLPEADVLVGRAMAMGPTVLGHFLKLSNLVNFWGDLEAAAAYAPTIPPRVLQEDAIAEMTVTLWIRLGKADKALEVLRGIPRDFLEEHVHVHPKHYLTGLAMDVAGRPAAAVAEWTLALATVEKRLVAEPNRTTFLIHKATLLARLKKGDEAERIWTLVRELSGWGKRGGAFPSAQFYAALGRPEDVVHWLQIWSVGAYTPERSILRYDPVFAPFRDDPRVKKIIADGVALLASWRKAPAPNPVQAAVAAPAPNQKSAPAEKSVAVLAFDNLSGDKENEYFSDGISEELLNVLAKVPGLRVAARTSAFYFKGRSATAQEIGQKLGVANLVEGSVRRAGTKVRIAARLSKADTGEQVWGESYEEELTDIFALQDKIAREISAKLQLTLAPGPFSAATPINPEAFRLCLEARFHAALQSVESLARAERLYEQALAVEPGFARALSGLAGVWQTRAGLRCAAPRFIQKELEATERLARRALEAARTSRDPGGGVEYMRWLISPTEATDLKAAEAHAVLAAVALYRREFAEAQAILTRNALAPGGFFYLQMGRPDLARPELRKWQEVDPLAWAAYAGDGCALLFLERYDEAIALFRRAESLGAAPVVHASHANALVRTGRRAEALAKAREAIAPAFVSAFPPGFAALAAGLAGWALADAGASSEAEAVARRLLAGPEEYRWNAAVPLLRLGRIDEAVPLLAAGYGQWESLFLCAHDPKLRHDQRVREVYRKLNMEPALDALIALREPNRSRSR